MRCHHTSFWYYKSLLHKNHKPTVSATTNTMAAMMICTTRELENVLLNRSLSPLPNSKVRKRDVAPDIEALRNPIIATIPPTTPYIP